MNADSGQQSSFQKGPPAEIHPPPDDIAEYRGLRRREMGTIADRLGRFPKLPWAQVWAALAAILIGAAAGGALSAAQLDPDTNKVIYWGIVGGVFAIGLLAVAASYTTHSVRTDSIVAIKEDLDRLLDTDAETSTRG